jgi:hypothetical protein
VAFHRVPSSKKPFRGRSRARRSLFVVVLAALGFYPLLSVGSFAFASSSTSKSNVVRASSDLHAGSAAAAALAAKKFAAPNPVPPAPGTNSDGKLADSHYCDGCEPPLIYLGNNAPVVTTSGTKGFTITPIFWEPAGNATPFPAGYVSTIEGYIKNVAAASGTTSNVYSIASEYSQTINGVKTTLTYKISAGTPIIDKSALPTGGCTASAADGYIGCVNDTQLQAELAKIIKANTLSTGLANFYPVFFPNPVETYGVGGNSDSVYCGYHSSYGSGATTVLYGNEPFESSGCDGGEAPNGNAITDGAISVLSHETSETMTDPTNNRAWNDAVGDEIGDVCAGYYGPPIGSTNASDPADTAYNQVINGGTYYTQTEFSDLAYSKLGIGNGCVPNEAAATGATTNVAQNSVRANDVTIPVVGNLTNDAFPNTLPADGTSTSDLDIAVSDPDGFAISGDKVNYSTYAISGTGSCGTLSARSALTNDGGHASVTYTASTADVICAVVATDVYGGQSATGAIYQGSYQDQAVVATAAYPTKLTVGAPTSTFHIAFKNPTEADLPHVRVQFGIFAGQGATDNVDASKVALSYSTTGANGAFTNVDLEGSTITDGEIQGVVLPLAGVTIPAGKALTIYFHIQLKAGVSTAGGGAGLAIESYLDQVNPGSGALDTLGDTLAYEVAVAPAASGLPSVDGVGYGSGPTSATADLSTGSSGDLIVAVVSGGGPVGATQTATVSGGGLHWNLVARINDAPGTTEVWEAVAGSRLSSVPITATLSSPGWTAYLGVVAFKNAGSVSESSLANAFSGYLAVHASSPFARVAAPEMLKVLK